MNTKRKGIYKILIILTTIVCLLNGCIRLFNTFADTVQGSTSVGSPEEFMTDYGESTSYLWYKYIESETDTKRVYAFVYTPLPDDIEYSESGDIISFTASNKSRKRGYDYTFSSGNYGLKYNSQPSIYDFSVNVAEKSVNGQDCEDVYLCINGFIYDSNALNVEVIFNPALVGVVDREIDNNGVKSYMSELKMTVINHCSYPIQFKMDITAKEQTNTRPSNTPANYNTYYSNDPVFKFYKQNWVWNKSGLTADPNDSSDLGNVWSDIPTKFNKASEWHYLAARSTNNQTFKYSQINLQEGVEYTVTVYACRCDYDMASENFIDDYSENVQEQIGFEPDQQSHSVTVDADSQYKQLNKSSVEIVYRSDFSMLHYSDVVYNPNDTSNGVLPYNGYDGSAPSQKYNNSYNAWEDLDGNKGYTNKDGLPGYSPGGYSSGTVQLNGDYNGVLAQTSTVFLFISSVLGFFPTDIFIVLNICLWSIVIIVIIRRLK